MCSGYATAAILCDIGKVKPDSNVHGNIFNEYYDNWERNHSDKDIERMAVKYIKITGNKYKGSDTASKQEMQKINKIKNKLKTQQGELTSKDLQHLPGATTTAADMITANVLKPFNKTIYFNYKNFIGSNGYGKGDNTGNEFEKVLTLFANKEKNILKII